MSTNGQPTHQDDHKEKPNLLHPSEYQHGVYVNGLQGQRPILSFDPHEWEKQAGEVLNRDAWGTFCDAIVSTRR